MQHIHTPMGLWVWGKEGLRVSWITHIRKFHLTIVRTMHVATHTSILSNLTFQKNFMIP